MCIKYIHIRKLIWFGTLYRNLYTFFKCCTATMGLFCLMHETWCIYCTVRVSVCMRAHVSPLLFNLIFWLGSPETNTVMERFHGGCEITWLKLDHLVQCSPELTELKNTSTCFPPSPSSSSSCFLQVSWEFYREAIALFLTFSHSAIYCIFIISDLFLL